MTSHRAVSQTRNATQAFIMSLTPDDWAHSSLSGGKGKRTLSQTSREAFWKLISPDWGSLKMIHSSDRHSLNNSYSFIGTINISSRLRILKIFFSEIMSLIFEIAFIIQTRPFFARHFVWGRWCPSWTQDLNYYYCFSSEDCCKLSECLKF